MLISLLNQKEMIDIPIHDFCAIYTAQLQGNALKSINIMKNYVYFLLLFLKS